MNAQILANIINEQNRKYAELETFYRKGCITPSEISLRSHTIFIETACILYDEVCHQLAEDKMLPQVTAPTEKEQQEVGMKLATQEPTSSSQ